MRASLLISAAVLGWFFLHRWLRRLFTTWRLRNEYDVMYGKLQIRLANVRQRYNGVQSTLYSPSEKERPGLSSAKSSLEQIGVELGVLCDLNPHPADKLLPEFIERVEKANMKLEGALAAIRKAGDTTRIQPQEGGLEVEDEMSDASPERQERTSMFEESPRES